PSGLSLLPPRLLAPLPVEPAVDTGWLAGGHGAGCDHFHRRGSGAVCRVTDLCGVILVIGGGDVLGFAFPRALCGRAAAASLWQRGATVLLSRLRPKRGAQAACSTGAVRRIGRSTSNPPGIHRIAPGPPPSIVSLNSQQVRII